jgi:hypothetical protein
LGALDRYFIEQIKNIKPTTIFSKKNWFRWLEVELLKIYIFKKSKKIINEQQLYDVCLLQVVFGACLNFFLN